MKLFKRIPKRWALLIYLLLLALLLASAWVLLDYPSLTAAAAFRRGLEDADLPVLDLELRENDVGLAADEEKVYLVRLGSGAGWQYYDAWTVPAAEGVLWAPLNWQTAGASNTTGRRLSPPSQRTSPTSRRTRTRRASPTRCPRPCPPSR